MSATLGGAAVSTKEELKEHYALADFNAEDANQVSFKKGDIVFVNEKDISGKHKNNGDAMKYVALSPAPGPFPTFLCCLLKLDHAYFYYGNYTHQ